MATVVGLLARKQKEQIQDVRFVQVTIRILEKDMIQEQEGGECDKFRVNRWCIGHCFGSRNAGNSIENRAGSLQDQIEKEKENDVVVKNGIKKTTVILVKTR